MNAVRNRRRVYVSGAFYNNGEIYSQRTLVQTLESYGFETFFPHRDGLKIAQLVQRYRQQGMSEVKASQWAAQDDFNYNVYQLYLCDALVSNTQGPEPDGRTASEAALAAAMGKPIILYSDDVRSIGLCNLINPFYDTLKTVPMINNVNYLNESVRQALQLIPQSVPFPQLAPTLQRAVQQGQRLARSGQINNGYQPGSLIGNYQQGYNNNYQSGQFDTGYQSPIGY